MNSDIFCCQPFKNEWKLAVLLLFSKFSASFSLLLAIPMYQKWRKTSCFAAIFKLFALLFSNFDEFQIFFDFFLIFSDFFQIFSFFCKIFSFFQIFFRFFQFFFRLFFRLFSDFSQIFLFFSGNFQFFVQFFQKFLKKIWKFSEKNLNQICEKYLKKSEKIENFLKILWIQRFSTSNHFKMKENSCFAAVFKVFS